jgi:HK97 family phage prohead protease
MYAPFEKVEKSGGQKYYLGVASSTSVDRDNERMSKSVLTKASTQLVGAPVLFNHDSRGLNSLALGKITSSYMDGEFLKIEWTPTAAQSVKDALIQVDEGILGALSVGGKSLNKSSGKDFDGQVIDDADFYEVSAVYIPANPEARILGSIAKLFSGRDGSLEKTRLATSATDSDVAAIGDGGEEDEKAPVVPAKKKKQKDGEKVSDDEVYESAKEKADKTGDSVVDMTKPEEAEKVSVKSVEVDVVKENGGVSPNHPALVEGEDEVFWSRFHTELKRLISIAGTSGKVAVQGNSQGAPAPLKDATVDLTKELSLLREEVSSLREKLVKKQSLVPGAESTAKSVEVESNDFSSLFKGAYKSL